MPPEFVQCGWCGRDQYPNQLVYSEHQGCKVCRRCRADQGPDKSNFNGVDIQTLPQNDRKIAK